MGLDDEDRAAFAALGVTIEEDDDEVVEIDPTEVWEEVWPAFQVFAALSTQWRAVGVGQVIVRLGLDYAEVDRMISRLDAPATAFWDVRAMEAEALPILNEAIE